MILIGFLLIIFIVYWVAVNIIPTDEMRGQFGAVSAFIFLWALQKYLRSHGQKLYGKELKFFDLMVTSEDNRYSLSRFQIYIWTVWVVITFVSVAFANNFTMPTVPPTLAVLMGIRGFTAALSTAISPKKMTSAFEQNEFTDDLPITGLCTAIISDGYNFNITLLQPAQGSPKELINKAYIEWLNNVLKIANLYELVTHKKTQQPPSKCIKKLYEIYQTTKDIEDLKTLNRCLLQEFYSQVTPKSRRACSPDFFRDLFLDKEGTLDLPRTQMFIWTLVILVIHIYQFWHDYHIYYLAMDYSKPLTIPSVNEGLLILMGVSNGAYLGVKQVVEKK